MIQVRITNTSAMIINMEKVKCDNCDWEWNLSDGGDDPYTCHKCGHNNEPSVINEEVNRMRVMMGLQEQSVKDKLGDFWKNKVKPTAQKVGDAVQTGVHNASQKIADMTKKPEQQQPAPEQKKCRNPYVNCIQPEQVDALMKEWSAVNNDMSNFKGFGTGISKNDSLAQQMAEMAARTVILKKLKKNNASFGTEMIDITYCDLPNGTIQYFVILEKS